MSPPSRTPLRLDSDDLAACVACGLCLPHCPTYRVTGLEIASPRGRIAAMRAVEAGDAPIDTAFARAMEECVQCRGCETACPSGVPFGRLMEDARAALASAPAARVGAPRGRRVAERALLRGVLPHPCRLRAVTWVLWLAQRLRLVPRRFALPRLRARDLRAGLDVAVGESSTDVWLFTGCVMDAWQRHVHRAVVTVLRACAVRVSRPDGRAACCGALHLHAGHHDDAIALARRVITAMPGDAPIVVDAAGCGAALRDYGRLLRTADARAFSARVRDFSEYALECGARDLLGAMAEEVVVQDPCHLRHVQKVHGAVRDLLGGAYTLVETADDGLCCGAGGIYGVQHPELAQQIRARKVAALRAAARGGDLLVCSANPGCSFHLAAAGLTVRHPAELAAAAIVPSEQRG